MHRVISINKHIQVIVHRHVLSSALVLIQMKKFQGLQLYQTSHACWQRNVGYNELSMPQFFLMM